MKPNKALLNRLTKETATRKGMIGKTDKQKVIEILEGLDDSDAFVLLTAGKENRLVTNISDRNYYYGVLMNGMLSVPKEGEI